MLTKNLRSIIRFAVPAMALPVIITTACGTNITTNTLLDGTFSGVNDTTIRIDTNPCYDEPAPAHNGLLQTFNAVAGKLVTCNATGPTATSRPRIFINDFVGTPIAITGTPNSQTTTLTFTPVANTLYGLTVEDCTPSGAGNYTLLVTQAK